MDLQTSVKLAPLAAVVLILLDLGTGLHQRGDMKAAVRDNTQAVYRLGVDLGAIQTQIRTQSLLNSRQEERLARMLARLQLLEIRFNPRPQRGAPRHDQRDIP